MTVYTIDPLHDRRWPDLVERHPDASVFHTTAWLRALQRTYGYQPVVFTTSAPAAQLEDGIVFCRVRSWLTGHRLVSLPFSDHCEPLVEHADAFDAIATHLNRIRHDDQWEYIELRPHTGRFDSFPGLRPAQQFWLHRLDLQPSEKTLFGAFHKDSIQRKIRRAQREQLAYEDGRGERLLGAFYELLLVTRRRHQLPPQPFVWFRNLADACDTSMKIRVAWLGARAVAAIVTIRHRDVMVYKYGVSDARFHSLGGMHLLFWQTIQDARAAGCTSLDLGRCDTDNDGLATFKGRWGATLSDMTYRRYTRPHAPRGALRKYAIAGAKQVLDHAPDACRVAVGRFLYRHAG